MVQEAGDTLTESACLTASTYITQLVTRVPNAILLLERVEVTVLYPTLSPSPLTLCNIVPVKYDPAVSAVLPEFPSNPKIMSLALDVDTPSRSVCSNSWNNLCKANQSEGQMGSPYLLLRFRKLARQCFCGYDHSVLR